MLRLKGDKHNLIINKFKCLKIKLFIIAGENLLYLENQLRWKGGGGGGGKTVFPTHLQNFFLLNPSFNRFGEQQISI